MDPRCIAPGHDARVPALASDRGAAADRRARVTIALSALCPVLVGLLVTAGTSGSDPGPPPQLAGHWVYVPGLAAAVHVDGETKQVDATVPVGAAGAGSPVLQGGPAGYVVDVDRVIAFGPTTGVTGGHPGVGVAETPVPVETAAAAYLVYRTAGLVVRLHPERATVRAGGPLGDPVADRDGTLWAHRVDTGAVCALGPADTALSCPARVPAGHRAALSSLRDHPVLVDVTAGTVQPVARRGAGTATRLGVALPPNARIGPADAGGRLPVLDPGGRRLLLVQPGGDAVAVPLGPGRFDRPVSSGDAVALVDQDTGKVASYDSRGQPRGAAMIRTGGIRTTRGEDGRVYADATDGRQSVVMDGDGTLTVVRYGGPAPSYRPPVAAPRTTAPPTTPPPAGTPDPTTTAPHHHRAHPGSHHRGADPGRAGTRHAAADQPAGPGAAVRDDQLAGPAAGAHQRPGPGAHHAAGRSGPGWRTDRRRPGRPGSRRHRGDHPGPGQRRRPGLLPRVLQLGGAAGHPLRRHPGAGGRRPEPGDAVRRLRPRHQRTRHR